MYLYAKKKKEEEEETKTLEESHILEISSESHKVKQPSLKLQRYSFLLPASLLFLHCA